ncbi:MAG: tRNA epoxyqueuosine(34) reductase QueG [Phycisphaerales bacterium]|nr:MAG: tRNA epoxyqueuosine(34) reductase QueG [Phycisphaerales bacterium]
MPLHKLTQRLKDLALSLGFDRCRIVRADPIGRTQYVRAWLESGRAGTMEYLHRNFKARTNPRELLRGAKSVIVVALQYYRQRPPIPDDRRDPRGRVAMYAWGDDYHDIIKAKLRKIDDYMRSKSAEPFDAKACVDTGALMERELAAAAGIGWIGKNTMVLHHQLGSYFFLGALVTTLDLVPDQPVADRCGTCTACLEACPTEAFPAPHQMDASRCISYLTIEHRHDIPESLKPKMGDWIFGCDVCQEVCPYNHHAPTTREPRFKIRPPGPQPKLEDILGWSMDDCRTLLRGSALRRATLQMLKRNALIAKANADRALGEH